MSRHPYNPPRARTSIVARFASQQRAWVLLVAVALVVVGCGAKTGLLVPCRRELIPIEPEIIFVLDASGSTRDPMPDGGTAAGAWSWSETAAAVESLTAGLDQVVPFGVTFFPVNAPGHGADTTCAMPPGLGVEPRLGVSDELPAYFSRVPERGNSPLTPTMRRVLEYVQSHPIERHRVIILVTDGVADCNADLACDTCYCPSRQCCLLALGSGAACFDDIGPANEIERMRRAGAETAVIGIHTGGEGQILRIADSVLTSAAAAGGFGDVLWIERGDMGAALETTIARARDTCQFALGTLPFATDFSVSVDGQPVIHSADNGWEYSAEHTAIQLSGTACARYRAHHGAVSIAESSTSHCER